MIHFTHYFKGGGRGLVEQVVFQVRPRGVGGQGLLKKSVFPQ